MCILGLCALIDLEHRPQAINQVAGQLLPAAILLFNGLKRAYACRAEHENDDDDDEDGEEEDENGETCFDFQRGRYIQKVLCKTILSEHPVRFKRVPFSLNECS